MQATTKILTCILAISAFCAPALADKISDFKDRTSIDAWARTWKVD